VWGSVAAPMGGRGSSGLGRRHGAEGLLRFTDGQSVVVHGRVGYGPLFALGGSTFARVMTRAMQVARALRVPWP